MGVLYNILDKYKYRQVLRTLSANMLWEYFSQMHLIVVVTCVHNDKGKQPTLAYPVKQGHTNHLRFIGSLFSL